MKLASKQRVAVIFNRDFEGIASDPENCAREDVRGIAEGIVRVLSGHGFESSVVGVTDDVFATVRTLRELAPAAVFNLCESICGDNRFEALMPLLLEKEGIAFTGSGSLALASSLHKNRAKEVLRAHGVPTPASVMVSQPDVSGVSLPFPLIVKPSREDASVGIYANSVVRDVQALEERVRHVLTYYRQPALIEQYIEGREIYVSLLDQLEGAPQVFPFFEIDFTDLPAGMPRIVSFEAKWREESPEFNGTRPVRCAGLSPELEKRIASVATDGFRAMELRDYGRLDFRLHADGTPYVIDVNPNCDLSDQDGGYARAARAAGMSYDQVILRIVQLALARRDDMAAHASSLPAAGSLAQLHTGGGVRGGGIPGRVS